MKEQLITFGTAKLAKEKGFDKTVNSLYYIDEVTEKPVLDHWINQNFSLQEKHHFSAPTQSLLENWLFENYSINIELTFDDGQWLIYVGEFSFPDSSVEFVDSIACDSFEEAKSKKLEAKEKGLQEALKLIN